jgi:energy-coupling factor transporter ATP-binding protein EcfA2
VPDVLKKLLLTLTQLPLLGALWLWWDRGMHIHPVTVISLAVLYEVVVGGLAFGKRILATVSNELADGIAEWMVEEIKCIAPGFRRRYKRRINIDFYRFETSGLGSVPNPRNLADVFVDLRIDADCRSKPNNDPIEIGIDLGAQAELSDSRPIWDFMRLNLLSHPKDGVRPLAVIGAPGCGKTTLLRHIALTFANNRQRRYKLRSRTPILLQLRAHTPAIIGKERPSLAKLAQDHFSDSNDYSTLNPPPNWFKKQLERGRCVILLDGLDEVADIEERKMVSRWVDIQIRNYSCCPFILTARPLGYRDAELDRAIILDVQPFSPNQVRRFVERWCLGGEEPEAGRRGDNFRCERARKDANDLLQQIHQSPTLSALAASPLLLTMIAIVHSSYGTLPHNRVGLYRTICEALLKRWREPGEMPETLSVQQKFLVLRTLAAYMTKLQISDIMPEAAKRVLAAPLKRMRVGHDKVEAFLHGVLDSGILQEREAGRLSFMHRTVQEYLTAVHWQQEKIDESRWGEKVGDSWWHETLLLFAAQGDASRLIEACMDVETVPALTLAADCLEEALEIDPDVRRRAEDRVIADPESPDPARRRLAAEVRLSRRLKSLQHIDKEREIDTNFLTCAEYQLFLDDMRAQGRFFQPDHWTSLTFAAGEAGDAISGVRTDDAVAFCDWLTNRQGGGRRYRLPSPDEARRYAAKTVALAAWCRDGDEFKLTKFTDREQVSVALSCMSQVLELRHFAAFSRVRVRSLTRVINLPDILQAIRQFVDEANDEANAEAKDAGRPRARYFKPTRGDASVTDYARARDLAHALTRTLDRVLDRANARSLARVAGVKLDHALDLALRLALSLSLDRDLDLTGYLDLTHEFACYLAKGLASTLRQESIVGHIEQNNLPEAQSMAEALLTKLGARRRPDQSLLITQDAVEARLTQLLNDILATATTQTELSMRQTQRKYAMHMLEYAYIGIRAKQSHNHVAWWRRLLYVHKEDDAETKPEQERLEMDVSELYWWLQVIMAREDGTLSAWEGIRIVREQSLNN